MEPRAESDPHRHPGTHSPLPALPRLANIAGWKQHVAVRGPLGRSPPPKNKPTLHPKRQKGMREPHGDQEEEGLADLQRGNLGDNFVFQPGKKSGLLLQLLDKRVHGGGNDCTATHRAPISPITGRKGR